MKNNWTLLAALVAGTFALIVWVQGSTVSTKRFEDHQAQSARDVAEIKQGIRDINRKLDSLKP